MNIGELFIKLGFKADTFTLKDFGKALSDMPLKALGAVGAIAGVSFEIGHLATKAMDAAEGFEMFTATTGKSADYLQRWQNVARQLGVSKEAVTSTLVGLNNALGAIETGQGKAQAMAFGMLHVDYSSMDVEKINDQLRQRIKNMNPDELRRAQRFLGTVGVSPDMLRLYRGTDAEFARGMTVPIMNKTEVDAAARLRGDLVHLAEVIEGSFNKSFGDFAEGIEKLGPLISDLCELLVRTLKILVPVVEWLGAQTEGLLHDLLYGSQTGATANVKSTAKPGGGLFGGAMGKAYQEGYAKFEKMMDDSVAKPIRAALGTGTTTNNTTGDVNIHVHSNGDPAAVSQLVAAEAKRQRLQAAASLDNGGHR